MAQNIYFLYEPNTGHYLRAVFADTKPANSTELEPTGLVDAVFNTDTNKWEGTSIADEMAKAKKSAADNVDPYQQRLASVAQMLLQKSAQQDIKIAQLTAQIKGGN
ncbi:hypothetical protein ACT5YR_00085 [Fructobacillus fructosus]|uniref:Uncharacterized protein n=1 Tax=Fructobacillus fructosus TaxID=1631 RepID=A0ABN9YIP4_9LACO|nr:unnamed protein product [Fructobacillus fructosus]